MRLGRTPGVSRLRIEDLRAWHENVPEAWKKLLELIAMSFTGESIPMAFGLGILVLPYSQG